MINNVIVGEYMTTILESSLKDVTINFRVNAIKRLFKEGQKEGLIDYNPADNIN